MEIHTKLMPPNYPLIKVVDALTRVDGNQAELGRQLGYKRAYVNEWLRTNREHLPETAAYRFVRIYGEPDKAA